MSLIGGVFMALTGTYVPEKRRLAGEIKINSAGVARRFALFHRGTLLYLGSGKTKDDGTWVMSGFPTTLSEEDIFCVYLHDDKSLDPTAFDNIALEV